MWFDVPYVMYQISKKQITAVMKNWPLAVPFALLGQLSSQFCTAYYGDIHFLNCLIIPLRMGCNNTIFGLIFFEKMLGWSLMTSLITLWAVKSYAHPFPRYVGAEFYFFSVFLPLIQKSNLYSPLSRHVFIWPNYKTRIWFRKIPNTSVMNCIRTKFSLGT